MLGLSCELGNEAIKKKIKELCDISNFCPECFNLYPVIKNISILNKNSAILQSKFENKDRL